MWQKIKDFWNSISLKAKLAVIGAGIVVFIAKYRDVMMSLLFSSAKRLMDKTEAKDEKLASEENQAKEQANKLLQEVKDLPSTKEPVTKDWYKK